MGQKKPNCNKTYIMYHGTTRTNAEAIKKTGFRQSEDGMLGRGVYLSRDLNKASRYPLDPRLPDSERVVFRVKVNVGNVIAIDRQYHPRQKNWHDGRYGEVFDTAWCPPDCGMTASGLEEDCVWDPNRITIVRCIAPTPYQILIMKGASPPSYSPWIRDLMSCTKLENAIPPEGQGISSIKNGAPFFYGSFS
ncbi:unnamed protein product, partial [Lota lota]